MSLRLEMLQVARLAPKLLGDSTSLVVGFLRRQRNDDGGFRDRNGRSDLYYAVFGLDGLIALQADVPVEPVRNYLRRFGDGEGLDFVHLCCLARAWAIVTALQSNDTQFAQSPQQAELSATILRRIEGHRSADGGYNPVPGNVYGTAYGCFLGQGAYEDLHSEAPKPQGLATCLAGLKTTDGAWANDRNVKEGSTNATAAAVQVLRRLGQPIPLVVGDWLSARSHAQGGFLAAPGAPIPDLLSTATTLHALAGMQVPLGALKERCLDFVDSLWTNEGAFHGHWADDSLDCEYTFYGLLALGHLSL